MKKHFKNILFLEKLVFILSAYVIIELYLRSVLNYSENTKIIVDIIDTIICGVFLYEFFLRLVASENRMTFIKKYWIDFVSSIPMIGFLRIGRITRIIRFLRIFRSGRVFYRYFDKNNSFKAFKYILVLIIILICLSALSVFIFERQVNPDFSSIGDALWWSTITTTTLGFVKDITPLTIEGKIFSILLIGMGIVLFGTFTGMVTDYFVGDEEIKEEIKELRGKIEKIENNVETIINLIQDKNNKDL